MKKWTGILLIALFLLVPLTVNAIPTPLGNGNLNVDWSGPTDSSYYLDYDGTVVSSNFGYTTGLEEIFCVSSQNAPGVTAPYTFYKITADLLNFASLSKAAWIADHWTDWGTDDATKGEAQKAVWQIVGVMSIVGTSGKDYAMLNAANQHPGYLTTSWYYAYSPALGIVGTCLPNYQDYLTPAPVPEPTTMLLLGLGLIGLAGIGRRIRK